MTPPHSRKPHCKRWKSLAKSSAEAGAAAVIHRPKHDKTPRRKDGKLADHPAMKELSRMIKAGEVNRDRTLAYLKKGQKP